MDNDLSYDTCLEHFARRVNLSFPNIVLPKSMSTSGFLRK